VNSLEYTLKLSRGLDLPIWKPLKKVSSTSESRKEKGLEEGGSLLGKSDGKTSEVENLNKKNVTGREREPFYTKTRQADVRKEDKAFFRVFAAKYVGERSPGSLRKGKTPVSFRNRHATYVGEKGGIVEKEERAIFWQNTGRPRVFERKWECVSSSCLREGGAGNRD